MKKHFENLWEEAENLENESTEESINELILKCQILNSIKDKDSFELLFGEILFCMTKISKSKDINVYKALNAIIHNRRKIDL